MQNDSVDEIPVFPVSSAVDTTGAGDCFAAGFLYGLTRKMDSVGCACFGNAAASCCVEQAGATDGIVSGEIPWERFKELNAHPLLASDLQ